MSSTKRTPEHPRLYVSAATAAEAAAEAVEAAAEAVEAAPMPAAEVVAEVEEAAPMPAVAEAAAEAAPPMPAVAEDVATTTVAAEAAAAAAEAAEVASGFGGAAVAAVAVEAIGAGGQATVGPGAIDLACRRGRKARGSQRATRLPRPGRPKPTPSTFPARVRLAAWRCCSLCASLHPLSVLGDSGVVRILA